MTLSEYLLSYGCTGEFGRFHPVRPLTIGRGERAVIRSHRGLELGQVLCPATPGHARVLPNTTVGQLLRIATTEDEQAAEHAQLRGHELFTDARRLAGELSLPLEVLDAEVLLDGEHSILHHLPWDEFDERELVSRLSKRHALHVRLHSLRGSLEPAEEQEHEGCGRPGCGREAGGCGSCSSGGCSSCGVAGQDTQAYFAALREQMHSHRRPLL
jgi:hypothetical protein